jgi:hypothetical protein
MSLVDNALNLFGLQIKKTPEEDEKNNSGALSVGLSDDSSAVSVASSASLGLYLDVDGQIKSEIMAILKYRDISLYPEVDSAIQDILNEAIPMEPDTEIAVLNLDHWEQPESVKKKFFDEFEEVKKLLYFETMASDMFRRWYVDGRLFFQIIVDKTKLADGIQKLIPLDAVKIKKIKEIVKKQTPQGADVIEQITEYYVYNENGFGAKNSNTNGAAGQSEGTATRGLKISPDAIIHVTSGYIDQTTGMALSYLHKAIRPINQLRMLEDATVVYFIARAPERRVFYVDVGTLPKLKAEQYMKDIMNRFRNKMVYNAQTGDIQNDKKYTSMLEDYFMPRRGEKGTEISVLPGAQNVSGYLDSLDWFKEKMYEALNVPKSRFQNESSGFSLGRGSEITRDELKFQKFVDRLRVRFAELLLQTLRTQLVLKGVCNTDEWNQIKQDIRIDFQKDNYFSEFKEQDMLTARMMLLAQADLYLQKYFSKKYVQKNVLRMTDEDIEKMDQEIEEEKDDESAQPGQPGMPTPPPMPPGMEGGDPSQGGMPPGINAPGGQDDEEASSGVSPADKDKKKKKDATPPEYNATSFTG